MKKPFLIATIINAALILLLGGPFIFEGHNLNATIGLIMLIAAAANLIVGIMILLISIAEKQVAKYGAAFMAIAGICLLAGFTLCSQA